MFPIKMSLSKLVEPCVFTHHAFQWEGTLDKSLRSKCFLQNKGLKTSTEGMQVVQNDNTVVHCPKIRAFLSVLTWQPLPWQLNWVICPCRCCSSVNTLKDRVQEEECENLRLAAMSPTKFIIFSVIPLHLHTPFDYYQHVWIIYHLRAPPCGCFFPSVCLTMWTLVPVYRCWTG